jgi:hypothetical protein
MNGLMSQRTVFCSLLLCSLLSTSGMALADFNWGSDCSSGNASFAEHVAKDGLTTIGTIPANKRDVRIDLSSTVDVDIQLIDTRGDSNPNNDVEIVAWPSGLLHGAESGCKVHQGLEYCYSGYNGTDGQLGNEWIEIHGITNTTLQMKAFGYQAGDFDVHYAWSAATNCNETGSGSFNQSLTKNQVSEIGVIPAGKTNVDIQLKSSRDLDIQLFAGNVALIQWPDGMLAGADQQTLVYEGLEITWSGYNGTNGKLGNEFVKIRGTTSQPLTMKAFAFQAGTAEVTYAWGVGTGTPCSSQSTCESGLECKTDTTFSSSLTCHTPTWCESNTSAANDCAGLTPPSASGNWQCSPEFTCTWQASSPDNNCFSTQDCSSGMTCMGIPHDGSFDQGKCVSTQSVPHQGQSCSPEQPCADNLPCAGLYSWGSGTCVAPWMAGTFEGTAFTIPDNGSLTTNSTIAYGLATVPNDMVIHMDLDHPRVQDLKVTLVSPNGDRGQVWDHNGTVDSQGHARIVVTGIPTDDAVNGRWTLEVQDDVAGAQGSVTHWELELVSQWD